jgi:hypothetical protein
VVHDCSPSPAPAIHATSSSPSQPSGSSFNIMGPHTALGTPQFLSINTNPLPAIQGLNMLQDTAHTPSTRITLYEPFGGMCSGLEAALLAGLHVGRYIYSDPDPAAQAVAHHRLHYLHTLFPSQFHNIASRDAFSTLQHDVDNITDHHILQTFTRDPQPLLIIAGWECQDLSPAGTGTGLQGTRSSTFYSLLQLVGTAQLCRTHSPTAYIIENVATAFIHNPLIQDHHSIIVHALGQPTTSDAAACGAASHRLRHFWTNMAPTNSLQQTIIQHYPTPGPVRPPSACAQHLLDPGRSVQVCIRKNPPPLAQVNTPGQPIQVLSRPAHPSPSHPGIPPTQLQLQAVPRWSPHC